MNNTMYSVIGMNTKDVIKPDIVMLDKTQSDDKVLPKVLPKNGLNRYLYKPGEKHGQQKRRAADLSGMKIHIG